MYFFSICFNYAINRFSDMYGSYPFKKKKNSADNKANFT